MLLRKKDQILLFKAHMKKLECYACHSSWAPQCYGCHVKTDYRKGKSKIDWIASGSTHFKNGETSESVLGTKGKRQIGKSSETRSYTEWENPILGINGEGLVTPIIPGCQVTYTVIGPKGETLILNKQARVHDNGHIVDAIDMSPVQIKMLKLTYKILQMVNLLHHIHKYRFKRFPVWILHGLKL